MGAGRDQGKLLRATVGGTAGVGGPNARHLEEREKFSKVGAGRGGVPGQGQLQRLKH